VSKLKICHISLVSNALPRSKWARLPRYAFQLTLLAVAGWFIYVFAGPNRHTVVAGKIYRSAQPSGKQLREQIDSKQIRTVMNLRGYCPDFDWYTAEAMATFDKEIDQQDITLSAKCLPSPGEVKRIIEVFDRSPYPILIHCKEGKDRTGLASAMALLLYTNATVFRARIELWPVWGHFRVARTVAMDEFFDRYEDWLKQKNSEHSPALFREWATKHYIAGVGRSEIKLLKQLPIQAKINESVCFTVRLTNRSKDVWEFKPGSTAAIQMRYSVLAMNGGSKIHDGIAGLLLKTVKPDESIELKIPLPPIADKGEYRLQLELVDYIGAAIGDRSVPFTKYGDEPLTHVFRVE
jgi:hypothetical protein